MSVPESLIVKFPMRANRELKLLQQGISYAHLGFLELSRISTGYIDGVQKLFRAYARFGRTKLPYFKLEFAPNHAEGGDERSSFIRHYRPLEK
jgi:hypothetical protein